jgi:GTPase SAR1 family protein
MTSAFFGKAQGALVVFDVSDKDSFNNLNGWIEEIEKVSILFYSFYYVIYYTD